MGDTPDNLDDDAPEVPPPAVPAVQAKEVQRSDFIETFNVREGANRFEVAANAVANRAMMQVNVAKLRKLCEQAMDVYLRDGLAPDSKTLKTLVDAVATVDGMSDIAYGDGKAGKLGNSLERLVYATTRAAIDGGAKLAGHSDSVQNRLQRLRRIGKAGKKSEIIDIK